MKNENDALFSCFGILQNIVKDKIMKWTLPKKTNKQQQKQPRNNKSSIQ